MAVLGGGGIGRGGIGGGGWGRLTTVALRVKL